MYASCRFEWWNEKLACIGYLVISFPSGIELTMVLRMVYWCTPIGITLQSSIFYTLASFGRHCLLYFLSKHMCKLQSKLHICRGRNCCHLAFYLHQIWEMILTPLIDIDNLNLSKIESLWSLMTKGEKNKDISEYKW